MDGIPKTRLRKLRTWMPGETPGELVGLDEGNKPIRLLDLASNDYLGLSQNPELIEAAKLALYSEGVGAGSSRFITGSRKTHKELEETLGEWLKRDVVIVFPSGFQANIAAVLALANRHTPVLTDRLIHHSLLTGVKASGAKLQRFKHNNLYDLEKHLKTSRHKQPKQIPLVITESLFSMEGTSAPIPQIAELCERYGAKLMVDEAHALGVMGHQGKGETFGLKSPITMVSGTFGKAFGSGGAFLATDKQTGENLIQTCGAFRYTTALAPPISAAALSALKIIRKNPTWGKELQKKALFWRKELSEHRWEITSGTGPIISLVLGSDEKALTYQNQLESAGLLTIAIRPPTVPEGLSRLRIIVRKNIPKGTLNKLIKALGNK